MRRLMQILNIRSGEEQMSLLLVVLILSTAVGGAIGGNATEALFFARFGVGLLPNMYMILGLFTFVTSMAITVLMGSVAKQRLYVLLPLVLGFALVGEWLLISLDVEWFFALMWLGMNVINTLVGLLIWGLAGSACDLRQAKRLFPLFSAGAILGTVFGGLITPPLANRLHAENLILLWALALFIAFFLSRALTLRIPFAPVSSRTRKPDVIAEMQRGYQFVRRSSIMRWVSYSAILFSVCFFSLALPFSRGATARLPDADQLAGFLGLFQGLYTGAALLISLFLANRFFARFGILTMLLVFPCIYLAGFGALALSASFVFLISFRFAQMAYMNGIAGTAWQALFSVVPPEQRDQVRAFVEGVPTQAGTFLAGLILLIGEQILQPQQLYLIGLTAAAILAYFIRRAGRDYSYALVDSLHAGQPQMFFNEEQPFNSLRADAAAVSVAIRGLSDPEAGVRRVSAEIVGHLPVPEAEAALVAALADEDAAVRVAALNGLSRARAAAALPDVSACLSDLEPEVRLAAIDSLWHLSVSPQGVVAYVEPLLSDSDPLVRAQAARVLLCATGHDRAREVLHMMAADPDSTVRARALICLGEGGDESGFGLAVSALDDGQPVVRKAAAGALADLNHRAALSHFITHLDDDDTSVRCGLAEALGRIGESALEPLVMKLSDPAREEGALMALEHLPVQKVAVRIRQYAITAAQTALNYHRLASGVLQNYEREAANDGRAQLLIESLQDKGFCCGLNALRAVGLLTTGDTMAVILENLSSQNAAQRANALETLESIGEKEIVRPLLVLWESGETSAASLPDGWLIGLLDDPSPWLRACAVLVAVLAEDTGLNEKLKTMSCSDPDEMVRALAENVLYGEPAMDTLTTLSMMERILFLRRVPLFAGLPPADLKQVAAITREAVFSDGQVLARQGEPGTEMYIIVSGEVRVLMTAEGQRESREVAHRRPGDYLGEMSILLQEPRIASLVADGAVRLLCINQKQFEGILRERPETSLALMRILSRRLKEARERVQ